VTVTTRSYTRTRARRAGFFDFLNSREKAIIIWAAMLVGFAAYKSDGLGSSLGAVLRSIFLTKLVFLFGAAAVYCAALVLAGNKLGLWHTSAIKEAVYWFFGSGVVLTGSAVTGRDDPSSGSSSAVPSGSRSSSSSSSPSTCSRSPSSS
jgi:hypothetical protein